MRARHHYAQPASPFQLSPRSQAPRLGVGLLPECRRRPSGEVYVSPTLLRQTFAAFCILGFVDPALLEASDSTPESLFKRGNAKRDRGDLDGAIADYTSAIESRSGFAEAYNNRGEARRLKGDLDSALADFDRAIETKPRLAVAYNN